MPDQKPSGFSFIELMISLSIVGVISVIAMPYYDEYKTKARISEAVTAFPSMHTELMNNLQLQASPPASINGVLWSDGTAVSGIATSNVEGSRFHGNGTDMYWFSVRLQEGILPSNLSKFQREIHYGLVKTNTGSWASYCGSWDNGSAFIATEFLPEGCDEPNVFAALTSAGTK